MHDPESLTLRLASLVEMTDGAEGPGERYVLWTQGCPLACPGCCNPHLWSPQGGALWTVAQVWARVEAARARHPELEGLTLVGGEPFEQDAPLAALARLCRRAGLSVMAFSGYTLEELTRRGSALLGETDLLVDGRYEEALRTTARRWVGSTNQRLHFLSDFYRPGDPRFAAPNHAELRLDAAGELRVVGFPFDSIQAAFGPASQLAREARRAERAGQAGEGEGAET